DATLGAHVAWLPGCLDMERTMAEERIACPFVYADGRKCTGVIYQARAYGPHDGSGLVSSDRVRKYRLWCSEKDDHAGAVSTFEAKERMEFYPDRLADGVEERLWSEGMIDNGAL